MHEGHESTWLHSSLQALAALWEPELAHVLPSCVEVVQSVSQSTLQVLHSPFVSAPWYCLWHWQHVPAVYRLHGSLSPACTLQAASMRTPSCMRRQPQRSPPWMRCLSARQWTSGPLPGTPSSQAPPPLSLLAQMIPRLPASIIPPAS